MPTTPDRDLDAIVERALMRLAEACPPLLRSDAARRKFAKLAMASDFAIDTLCRQPGVAERLDGEPSPLALDAADDNQWPAVIRRWRAAQSTRLVWRDVHGLDTVEATLAGSTRIAEQALQSALAALDGQFSQRHGRVLGESGEPQSLVVFGLGKLGGGELNFSSDIDLVYAFPEHGGSDGARPLDAEAYFTRQGQRLAQLLGEVTADGFSHRVDLRLRPFGASGRLVLSFAAMEQYFQREGRDWERYAWIKARPVAGDIAAGERLLETLRPFVYRRYLDYTALDGLREMKSLIAAEVLKRELADHLKLGPGGIREIEFLVQALQLIRGGREPALRQRALLPALHALADAEHLPMATAERLADAYRFLRRLENRVQMLADAQIHALPDDATSRLRIARALDFDDEAGLRVVLDGHRAVVSEEFARLLEARRRRSEASAFARYWQAMPEAGDVAVLRDAGFNDAAGHDSALRDLARSPGVRSLPERPRQRLDHVLPSLLEAAAQSAAPDAAISRSISLLHAISRRSSYFALLEEQPAALARLIDVMARSALLAERLVAHPLLLDELLDTRAAGAPPDPIELEGDLQRAIAQLPSGDTEAALVALNELQESVSFRIALAHLTRRLPAGETARCLAVLAESVLRAALALAQADMVAAHGNIHGAGMALIGYGSLGGSELGFGSDLDLVFLHDADASAVSDGARPLEASRYFARLAQKVIALLGTITQAGSLYEVDMRLRPDGAKGLLVSTLSSFSEYQLDRAWTWEQQALVRARPVAGDAGVGLAFEEIRRRVFCRSRDVVVVAEEVSAMRLRMRAELDRSTELRFDIKQGEGGLVDIEFITQALLLQQASRHPALLAARDTPGLVKALRAAGVLDDGAADRLLGAHSLLLARSLDCTLDRRPRLFAVDVEIETARNDVRQVASQAGLRFNANE